MVRREGVRHRFRYSLQSLVLLSLFIAATATLFQRARIWKRMAAFSDGRNVGLAVFSDDGSLLVCLSRGRIFVWDIAGCAVRCEVIPPHGQSCGFRVFNPSPDNQRLVVKLQNNTVVVYDLNSGRRLYELSGPQDDNAAPCFADQQTILTCNRDKVLHIWNAIDGKEAASFACLQKWNGKNLALVEQASEFRLVDIASRRIIGVPYPEASSPTLIEGADLLIANDATGAAFLRNGITGDRICKLDAWPRSEKSNPTRLSCVGQRLIRLDESGARIWDSSSGRLLETVTNLTPNEQGSLDYGYFTKSPPRYVSITESGVSIWSTDPFRKQPIFNVSKQQGILAVSPDTRGILVGDVEGGASLWIQQRNPSDWGVAVLPEFWIALVTGGALLIIASRNLRKRPLPCGGSPNQ